MKKAGINLIEVKERNRALLLQSVCTAGSITRSELSEGLHLSPMTVTNITSELLQKHIIEEFAPQDPIKSPGRTPMLLRICRITPLTLFFAVGQGKMSVKAVKLCLQAFCTRRWEDVLRLTDQFAQKKRAATPSLWIWVMRYQAAAACGQWNTAQDALNALACFPHLTEWLNAAWTAGPQPIKRP